MSLTMGHIAIAGNEVAAWPIPEDLGKTESEVGGYGSGWQGSKKTTVEDSLCLSISSLVKKKALVAGSWTRGSWQWSYEGSQRAANTMGSFVVSPRRWEWTRRLCGTRSSGFRRGNSKYRNWRGRRLKRDERHRLEF